MAKFKLEQYPFIHINFIPMGKVLYWCQKKNAFGQISQNDLGVDYFFLPERGRFVQSLKSIL